MISNSLKWTKASIKRKSHPEQIALFLFSTHYLLAFHLNIMKLHGC